MEILVTGASGFVGSHLVRELIRQNLQVTIIARQNSRLDSLVRTSPLVDVQVYDGSICSLAAAFEKSKPDLVIHLASLYISEHFPNDVSELIASNVTFSTQLVDTMVKFGVKRLINTGTSWQHYRNQDYCPVNLYAATKQAFDVLLDYYKDAHGLEVVSLKLFDTYGPNDARPKLFSLLRRSASRQEVIEMSPGEQLIDLVYIDDVVRAYLLAISRFDDYSRARSYAVKSQGRINLRELVEIYARVTGYELKVIWGARPYRYREVMAPWDSCDPLPSWTPQIGLTEGIRRMEGTI